MPFTVSHGLLQLMPTKITLCCARVPGMLEWIFISNIFAHTAIISVLIRDTYNKFKIQTYWIGCGRLK